MIGVSAKVLSPGGEVRIFAKVLTPVFEVSRSSTVACVPRKPDGMPTPSRVSPLTDAERAALMLEVRRAGETAAAKRLGLSRNTIARALARLKLLPGTTLLIRNALAAVAGETTRGAA